METQAKFMPFNAYRFDTVWVAATERKDVDHG